MPKNTAGIGIVSWPIIFSLGSKTNPTTNAMRIVGINAISHALKMYFKGEISVMVKLDSIVGMNDNMSGFADREAIKKCSGTPCSKCQLLALSSFSLSLMALSLNADKMVIHAVPINRISPPTREMASCCGNADAVRNNIMLMATVWEYNSFFVTY